MEMSRAAGKGDGTGDKRRSRRDASRGRGVFFVIRYYYTLLTLI
jgi:hypothetical protein